MDFNRAIDLIRKDPDWLKKCAFPGLIFFVTSFIPLVNIAGFAAMLGWQRRIFDAAREGREELPEHDIGADLAYGVDPLLAVLNLLLPMGFVGLLTFGLPMIVGAMVAALLQGSDLAAIFAVGMMLFQVAGFFVFAAMVAFSFAAMPELLRRGFRGERLPLLSIGKSVALVRANPVPYLVLCACMVVANMVGGIGVYLCCVGMIITQPIGNAFAAHLLGQWDAMNPEG